ncbi:hypothetical protein LUZ60_005235 [Juncus effusus]|nr:hypothetical protein LUZ60_005235 [Juncus effusus]
MKRSILNLLVIVVVILQVEGSFGRNSDPAFLDSIRSQCPNWIELSSPSEVSGENLLKELNSAPKGTYYAILFYSSSCPFSSDFKPLFDSLSSMFPHIKHLSVEQSSAMPSLYSRYGVRGLPALLFINGDSVVRYYGTKNLDSLVEFYEEITSQSPITYITIDQPTRKSRNPKFSETIKEPYIALSLAFIFIKAIIQIAPIFISFIKSFLPSLNQYINSLVRGEPSPLWEKMLQMLNFNKIWSKIRVSNQTRNLRKGASNARVWASSLTCASLG